MQTYVGRQVQLKRLRVNLKKLTVQLIYQVNVFADQLGEVLVKSLSLWYDQFRKEGESYTSYVVGRNVIYKGEEERPRASPIISLLHYSVENIIFCTPIWLFKMGRSYSTLQIQGTFTLKTELSNSNSIELKYEVSFFCRPFYS